MVSVEPSDAEAERAVAAILAAFRGSLAQLPLSAERVEHLVIEAAPAVSALHFSLTVGRADDPISLAHHESTAMVALLGRACAVDDVTPSAAYRIVPCLLGAFGANGLEAPPALGEALAIVFFEGFLRGRDETYASLAEASALRHVDLVPIAQRIGLVVIRGGYGSDALLERLEVLAREAFRAQFEAVVVHVESMDAEALGGSLFGFCDALASVGIAPLVIGTGLRLPDDVPAFADVPKALASLARSNRRGAIRRGVEPLRALLANVAGRTRSEPSR